MSENPLLVELSIPNKDIKFITVNMLCRNLKNIDIQNNKLESLPEEIGDLLFLERLKLDHNLLKRLPANVRCLSHLSSLSFSNN